MPAIPAIFKKRSLRDLKLLRRSSDDEDIPEVPPPPPPPLPPLLRITTHVEPLPSISISPTTLSDSLNGIVPVSTRAESSSQALYRDREVRGHPPPPRALALSKPVNATKRQSFQSIPQTPRTPYVPTEVWNAIHERDGPLSKADNVMNKVSDTVGERHI
jgi:hypothetical protein